MRIGIDASCLLIRRSGVGQYTFRLLHALGRMDQDNTYHLLYLRPLRRSHGASLPSFPFVNFLSRGVTFPSRLFRLLTHLRLERALRVERFLGEIDIFHSPNYTLLPASARGVITIHDLTPLIFPQYHPWERVAYFPASLRASARRAIRVIADSENTRRDALKHLGISEEKLRVVPLAVGPPFCHLPAEKVEPVLQKYGLERERYLLYVGTIEPRKNLVRLIEAYHLIHRLRICRHPLLLVGQRGWQTDAVVRRVTDLGLEGEVRFLGYVPDGDVPYLMNGALCFAYPSLYEGFGLPVLEALACGTPVITSNTSSLPEVVGDTAIMVDASDVEALAKAMHRVLTDSELREEMQRRGLERAKLFSWEETARQTLKVYEEVYAERTPRRESPPHAQDGLGSG